MFGWTTLDEFAWFALGERDGLSDGGRTVAPESRSPSATSVGTSVETGAAAQSPLAPTYQEDVPQ